MMITPPTPPDGYTLVLDNEQNPDCIVPAGALFFDIGHAKWDQPSVDYCVVWDRRPIFYAIPNDKMEGLVPYGIGPDQSGSPLNSQIGGSHYKDFAIQPVEFITKNKLSFLEGCVVKRVCRHRSKNGAEDIRKAIHELELLLQLEYPTTP